MANKERFTEKGLKDVKTRDERINKTLKQNGYKVFRFTETQINKETVSTAEMVREVTYGF